MAMPFDKKYRPKKLSDVIGQEVPVQTLMNSFKSKNLHQAYIFAGNLGCGKTTVARIIAAMQNCEKGQTLEPCGECDNCKAIFSGSSLDVKEIDAASNRSINDIRDLKQDIKHCGINCRIKVIIIDEAHALTTDAAEASLKMIEEPPPNVMFILCTTSPQLLTGTIHSRCISFKFNKVSWSELSIHLKKICDAEKIEAEEDALKVIAKTSNGSVRSSLKNLEKVIAYVGSDGKLTAEAATKVLSSVDDNMYFHLLDSIITIKAPKAAKVINRILIDGKELSQVISGLTQHLRRLLIARTCQDNLAELDFSDDEIKKYGYQAGQLTTKAILGMADLISDMNREIAANYDPQSSLEKFAIKSMFLAKDKTE